MASLSLKRAISSIAATARPLTRIARIVAGFALLAVGIVLLALPGPGWLTIVGALALLATEFVWARTLLDRLKRMGAAVRARLRKSRRGRPDTPVAPDRSHERP
jgi:uncharacterized protein (TIGR02611 family)